MTWGPQNSGEPEAGEKLKHKIRNLELQIAVCALVLLTVCQAFGQVASHKPVVAPSVAKVAPTTALPVPKPVVKVNGAVLTEADLLREMYTIFPYGRQHNGFPKSMEAEIRQGALQMIIFEELVYQEAKRRNIPIPAARIATAEANFRKQFPDNATFQQYLQMECHGSRQEFREKVRRSLLIEQFLKTEVSNKAKVTLADSKAYYDKNVKQYQHGETFAIQTISIIPPEGGSADVQKDAKRKAEAALKLAKATKTYAEFGRLAEQISDDDWRVYGGDRKTVDRSKLPPEVVKAALAMKTGQVSDLIQLGRAYAIFRLNAHTTAGTSSFTEIKSSLQSDLQKEKTQQLRAALAERLRKDAKIDIL